MSAIKKHSKYNYMSLITLFLSIIHLSKRVALLKQHIHWRFLLVLQLIAPATSFVPTDWLASYAFSQSHSQLNPLGGRLSIIADPLHLWSLKKIFTNKEGQDLFHQQTGCQLRYYLSPTGDDSHFNFLINSTDSKKDVAIVPWFVAQQLVKIEAVQRIKTHAIKNWQAIDEKIKEAPWFQNWVRVRAPKGKKQAWRARIVYAIPLQWKPRLLAYNTRLFSSPPQSWRVLFEEMTLADDQLNTKRVQAFGSPMAIADAALYVMKARPELAIQNPYSLHSDQYEAALALMRRQYLIAGKYWLYPTLQIEDLAQESFVATSSWPFPVNILHASDKPVARSFPREGLNGRLMVAVIMRETENLACAYRWINTLLQPENQARMAASTGSVPVLPAACQIEDVLGEDECRINGATYFDKIHFEYLPEEKPFQARYQCKQQRCVPYSQWQSDFDDILSRRQQAYPSSYPPPVE